MDFLMESLAKLTDDEKKEFKLFLQRQRFRKERKDEQLFDILCGGKNLKPREIVRLLYDNDNMNAYHTLRKRLTRQFMDFIVLKRMDEDTTSASAIMSMISTATFMLDKNSPLIANKYLKKAEELANKNELYDLLDNIYNLQIRHAHVFGLNVHETIRRWEQNKQVAELDEKANVAYSLIQEKLREFKHGGPPMDLPRITNNILNELGLQAVATVRPKITHAFANMVRASIITTKDYYLFETYVMILYDNLRRNNAFGRKDHVYKMSFLYMIAHALYRNKKFAMAKTYLKQLEENMYEHRGVMKAQFYGKWVMLSAAVESYVGKNQAAVDLLKNALEGDEARKGTEDYLNMQLNTAVYLFQAEDFKGANRELLSIAHSDKWCEKKMGLEWRFKKNLIEIIVQIEMGNGEIALTKIHHAIQYFSGLFSHNMYKRAQVFLKLIKKIVTHPEKITSREFALEVNKKLAVLNDEKHDIQAISFYCWLQSKMQRKPYYEMLLKTVNETSPQVSSFV